MEEMNTNFLIENWCIDEGMCEAQCPLCGEVFVVDWINWINIISNDEKDIVIVCPSCGVVG